MNYHCRAVEPSDIDFVYRVENDQDYWTVADTRQPLSKDMLTQWLCQSPDVYANRQLRLMLCKEEQAIGCVDLFDIDFYHGNAQVAIFVDDKQRKEGAARFALSYMRKYAEDHLGLNNLFAEVDALNLASKKLFVSEGYEEIGQRKAARKILNQRVDIHLYQLRLSA